MIRIIKTERLNLTPCNLENLAEIHALWTNEKVKYFLFDDRTISLEESRSFVEASVENFNERGWGIWLVSLKGDDKTIGFAGLLKGEDEIPRLLYGLHPDYWRHGLAYEAACGVVDYVLQTLKIKKIVSDVDLPNLASVHILEKLGMKQTYSKIIGDKTILYYELV